VANYHEVGYGYTLVEIDGLTATLTFYKRTAPNTYVATSDTWSYTVNTDPQPPPAPTGLTAVTGNSTVTLSWNGLAEATSYNVKRASSPAGDYVAVGSGITSLLYVDDQAENGTTYYYVVSAVNDVGEGANSDYVSATPNPPPPPTPTSVTTVAGNAQVQLAWTGSAVASSYNVKRALSPSGPYTTIGSVTGTAFTDTQLANGTTYYYVVSAVNGGGESTDSAYASATPTAPSLPAPTGLVATSGPRTGQISLTWNKTTGATSYRVKRATVAGGPFTLVKTVPKPNYTDSKLTSKAVYYYMVTALDAAGESLPSGVQSASAK
jgi:fibronectin type 3 domain-containing protein